MVDWRDYLGILRRRWLIIALVVGIDVLVSGYLFARTYRTSGYQGCVSVYVADASSPSLILAPQSTLETAGQLLEGETAANFFGDDILDVAQSQHVAQYVSGRLAPRRLPNTATSDINGAVSGSRRDRTVSLCVDNPHSESALAAAQVLGEAMTAQRGRFIGKKMAQRTVVSVISSASVGKTPVSHSLTSLALRLILGIIVAAGLALLWDALDPRVRNRQDVELALGVPVLAASR